ncbi:Conserved_hypothetical protein [Hexamita inflata]|uniref:Uncharacterized protein n=1 Tax=Hexamita inflata TaxID=28002 RepID=A0AA86QWD5_9EUKA|nr:Conserved hypothetical protein [Hexamita inflata]
MLYLSICLNLNCFKQNSTVEYQKQTRMIRFTGEPNTLLSLQELKICNEILNDRKGVATIQIGTEKFRLNEVQFHADHELQFDAECLILNGCQYADVNKFSIATFQINFEDINSQISGVAGKFFIRIFNRMECHHETEAIYGADEFHLKLEPVETCMTRPSADQIQTNIFAAGKEMFELQESISDNLDAPLADLGYYIPAVTHLEFECSLLTGVDQSNCMQMLIQFQQKDQLFVEIILETPITVRYQNQVQTFKQSIRLTIKLVNHIVEEDCFSRLELTIFDDRLLVSAYPGPATKCSATYFSQFNYDSIQLAVSIIQNDDYTGFKFLASSSIQDYKFGQFYEKYFVCSELQLKNCSQKLMEAQTLDSNATFDITLKLVKNRVVQYKQSFQPVHIIQDIDKCSLEVHNNQICIILLEEHPEMNEIHVQIGELNKQINTPLETRTCTILTEGEQKQLHGFKVGAQPESAFVLINNNVLPESKLHIYDAGEKCWVAWVTFVGLGLVSVICTIIISFKM